MAVPIEPVMAVVVPAVPTALAPQLADSLPVRRAHYIAALRRMDWAFEWSDDHRVWTRGRDELTRLRAEQCELDPTGALWLANAPRSFPPIVSGPAS